MNILKKLMMTFLVVNAVQIFGEKDNSSVHKVAMYEVDENADDPALVHPFEIFFDVEGQDFQPAEIPVAVNEEANVPAHAPVIEEPVVAVNEQVNVAVQAPTIEPVVENVATIHLGVFEGTDTGLLVQAMQTGDMQPYVSFYKDQAKYGINQFLDQVFPGNDEIGFIDPAINYHLLPSRTKGAFKAAINEAIDIAVIQVNAPTGYQMRDLMRASSMIENGLISSIETFMNNSIPGYCYMNVLDQGIMIEQDALPNFTIDYDICTRDGLMCALMLSTETEFSDGNAVVANTAAVYPSVLAGTDTELLLQAMQTGDMQPYVGLYKDQLKNRINQFLDQVFPGDDEIGFIDPAINHHLLPAHTKGAFKAVICKTIDTTVIQVDAPTSYQMRDLMRSCDKIVFELYNRIYAFMESLTGDGMNVLDQSVMVDQGALLMDNIEGDVRSRDDLVRALLGYIAKD